MHTSMLGKIVEWVTGIGSIQKDERQPVTPTPDPKVNLSKFRNAQGLPTFQCYEYWADNVRRFDEYGEVTEKFMDWFRRIA